jgi:hypothetical protein
MTLTDAGKRLYVETTHLWVVGLTLFRSLKGETIKKPSLGVPSSVAASLDMLFSCPEMN